MTLHRRFGVVSAISAGVFAWLTLGPTAPALAEFEIQESTVEKGEVELEYRGAVHWGLPGTEGEAVDDGEEGEEEEDEAPLRQSHDFEFQWSVTDRWMFSTALLTDQPVGDNFGLAAVEFELQYELIEREGDGVGLSWLGAYGIATRGGEADEIEFGPIVELASGPLLLTLNPFLTSQVGPNRETNSLGFEYGWRAEYGVAKRWGIGVEMFGEIEDLANAGSFDNQEHSIGPTLFFKPGGDDDEGNGDDDDGETMSGPPEMEFSLNIGVQFALTDLTSDTALKFQGALEF